MPMKYVLIERIGFATVQKLCTPAMSSVSNTQMRASSGANACTLWYSWALVKLVTATPGVMGTVAMVCSPSLAARRFHSCGGRWQRWDGGRQVCVYGPS